MGESVVHVRTEGDGRRPGAPLDDPSFVDALARRLRSRTGLDLFNFDVVRDARRDGRLYVVDVNYFPGYYKMGDGYEARLVGFLAGRLGGAGRHVCCE